MTFSMTANIMCIGTRNPTLGNEKQDSKQKSKNRKLGRQHAMFWHTETQEEKIKMNRNLTENDS